MSDTPEQDRLYERLAGGSLHVTPGFRPASAEEMAKEINRVLDDLETGNFEVIDELKRAQDEQEL